MHNHNTDIGHRREPGDEHDNENRAVLKAQALLRSWRSRFVSGDQEDTAISRSYDDRKGGMVHIASPAGAAVSVTHVQADGTELVFAFGTAESGDPYLDAGGLPEAGDPPTPLELYDTFSRYLFDADRHEVRG